MEAEVALRQGQLGRSAMVPSSISALSSQRSCNLFPAKLTWGHKAGGKIKNSGSNISFL